MMPNSHSFSPRYGRLARAFVLGVTACAAVASDSTLPARDPDPRGVRLEAFFKAYDCPAPLHVEEYLRAADSHALDYRHSSGDIPGGEHLRRLPEDEQPLGLGLGAERVPLGAGRHRLHHRAAGREPRYKGKTVQEKLFTYNPYPQYVRQVERLMQQIED